MTLGQMKTVLVIGAAMLLAACGGGSGGGGGTTTASAQNGMFVDSPVNGLHFTNAPSNTSGFTANGGLYPCMPNDMTTFDIGGTVIGNPQPCSANNVVTAVSVFGATSSADPRVVNLSQLLLTLAGGVLPGQNPINLPQPLPAGFNASKIPPFNQPSAAFSAALPAAFPAGTTMVTTAEAATHLATNFKTLSVTIVNSGTVSSSPAGINCTGAGTCSYSFVAGTAVTLTETGTGFQGYSNGTGSASCTGTSACAITMNADSGITATFQAAPPPATLIISTAGNGSGTVQCSANGGAFAACASSYPNPTPLVIQATANTGSAFTVWSNGTGNATVCNNTNGNCSFTLTGNSTVTANFTLNVTQFSVTGNVAPSPTGGGGTVACSANGGAAGPCGSYPVNTAISAIATPNSASNFTGWGATVCSGTGTCNFTLTANTIITANFNRPTLTVQVSGTGSVSSNPTGITNCTTSCSSPFDKGTPVTLTAGTGLTGWTGGGCSGTGTCMVTLNTDTTVTAAFSQGQGTTSTRWLFYADGATTIRYADPANPGATTTPVTTTAAAPDRMITATWDSANAAYTNLTAPYVTFFSGGKLWRVSALKSSGVPGSGANPPVQISSETTAVPPVCDENEVGSTTATSIKLFYELPGADSNCTTQNDNVTKWVTVSDNATTPPTALAPGLVLASTSGNIDWVTNLSTGAPTHVFLLDVANNNTLKLLNLTTNAITTIQANVGDVRILAQDTSDRVFLKGNNNANNIHVFLYTVSTNSLVTLVTGASPLEHGSTVGDGTNLYVAEQANGKLYKIPMTATQSADVVTLLASVGFPLGDPFGGDDVVVTPNNVFLHTYVPCSLPCVPPDLTQDATGLYRVPKTGGPATAIIAHATGTAIFNVFSANNLLYYNHHLPSSIPQANIIKEDGTAVFSSPASCFPCAGWSSFIASPSFFVRTAAQPPSQMILETFNSVALHNGATLTAFDAPTGTQGAALGTVPNTTPALASVFGVDFIDTAMLLVGAQNGSANNFVFFVDAALAGSLAQVPTGTAGPWFPVGF